MPVAEADVVASLKHVIDPNTGRDFVTGKAVKNVAVSDGDIAIDLALGYPAKSQHESLRKLVQEAIGALPNAGRVTVALRRRSCRTPCSAA